MDRGHLHHQGRINQISQVPHAPLGQVATSQVEDGPRVSLGQSELSQETTARCTQDQQGLHRDLIQRPSLCHPQPRLQQS